MAARSRSGATHLVVGFRLRAVRIALGLSWAALGASWVLSVRDSGVDSLYGPPAAGALVLVALSFVRWRVMLAHRAGDLIIFGWAVATVAAVAFAPDLNLGEPSFGAYMVAVLFAAILLPRPGAASVTLLAIGGLTLGDFRFAETLSTRTALSAVGLAAVAAAAAAIAGELEDRSRQESRESALERLYAVARSIGAGRSIPEVVPVLVRRVAESVSARTGMVFVYRPQSQALELLSPLWLRASVEETAEAHLLPLTEEGVPQRVYLHGTVASVNQRGHASGAWGRLTDELRIAGFVAVPLRTPDDEVGVMMVADKPTGAFSEHDVAAVADLAAPAALVVDHILRFQEARETSEKMAELAKLKSDFVSVVSHELRTPLTSIMGVLQTVTRPELAPDNPDLRGLLDAGVGQADRLKELIDDLLLVSQIDQRAVPVHPEAVDIADVIRDAVAGVAGAETLVGVKTASSLPTLVTDPRHLTRVLVNLIGNAVKYGDGSEIDVLAAPQQGELVITVADHGPGLPYELSTKAFEPFSQLRRTEVAGRGGIGLGLAICRGLVEAMGGAIRHEPTTGGGATFKVRVPFRPKVIERADGSPPT